MFILQIGLRGPRAPHFFYYQRFRKDDNANGNAPQETWQLVHFFTNEPNLQHIVKEQIQ